MTVAVVFHRFGPYHSARLEATSRYVKAVAVELASATREYGWNKVGESPAYPRVTLFPEGDSRDSSIDEVSRRMARALSDTVPDAVAIPGWSDFGALAALLWCARASKPAILMSESTAHDERRVWWREWVKRRVVRMYSTALVGGIRHADYLVQLGMPRERIFFGYDAVDNGYFARSAKEIRGRKSEVGEEGGSGSQRSEVGNQREEAEHAAKEGGRKVESGKAEVEEGNPRSEIRSQKSEDGRKGESRKEKGEDGNPKSEVRSQTSEDGREGESRKEKGEDGNPKSEVGSQKSEDRNQRLPENYFLALARFIPKKNLFALIRAYARYRRAEVERRNAKGEIWHLVLLGDGPLRSDLCRLTSDLGLEGSVHLPGFKQYDELPEYYAHAKAFVHASTSEQWGLVVNEAAASGLPVIVSSACGCVPELVREGVNGWTFDPQDESDLVQRLLEMASLSDEQRKQMGAASAEIISEFGPERFGKGLKDAAELALSLPRKPATWFDRALVAILMRK